MPAQPAEIDQQKAALLSAIAQQGSQGQAAFAAEAQRRQAAQQAAVAQIQSQGKMTGLGNAPAAFTAQLVGKQNALGDIYAQDAAMSKNTFDSSIAQTSAANAAYMDQARAALPIVNAQTAGTVAQIRAEQQAAAEERAYMAEQRRIEAEEAAKDRAFTEQQRQWEREDRLLGADEENTANRQEALLTRATVDAHPAVAIAAEQIAGTVDTMEQAIKLAPRIIDEIAAKSDTPGAIEGFTSKDRQDLYRYIYEYFTGEKAPVDPTKLGEAYKKQGIDPERIPGYVSEADKNRNLTIDIAMGVTEDALKKRIAGMRSTGGTAKEDSGFSYKMPSLSDIKLPKYRLPSLFN